MVIVIYCFTLIIAFIVFKLIVKAEYTAKENPLWKKLVYWGIILFISAVFNIVMYINNTSMYRLSSYSNSPTLELIIFIILSCIIIQIVSPSISFNRIKGSMKTFLKRTRELRHVKNDINKNQIRNINVPMYKRTGVYRIDRAKSNINSANEYNERHFELFLNALCVLSFSYAVFVNIISFVMLAAYGNNHLLKYDNIQMQLNYISCIMLIFTLPISFRQITFYLIKLRKSTEGLNKYKKYNSPYYERYMLAQKKLSEMNKKL